MRPAVVASLLLLLAASMSPRDFGAGQAAAAPGERTALLSPIFVDSWFVDFGFAPLIALVGEPAAP